MRHDGSVGEHVCVVQNRPDHCFAAVLKTNTLSIRPQDYLNCLTSENSSQIISWNESPSMYKVRARVAVGARMRIIFSSDQLC